MNGKQERVMYVDLLRVISMISVIILHVSSCMYAILDIESINWFVANIFDSLVRFGVPVFVMISGVFFLNQNKEYGFEKLYNKNIFRISIAYIFWSAFYSIINNVMKCNEFNINLIIKIARDFVLGEYHLWFLQMLLGLYILVPLVRKLCSEKKLMEYFLILSVIFCFIPNFLQVIPSVRQNSKYSCRETKNIFCNGICLIFYFR